MRECVNLSSNADKLLNCAKKKINILHERQYSHCNELKSLEFRNVTFWPFLQCLKMTQKGTFEFLHFKPIMSYKK